LLPCKLTPESHFAGRKSLLDSHRPYQALILLMFSAFLSSGVSALDNFVRASITAIACLASRA
jgi:hypothetical protein